MIVGKQPGAQVTEGQLPDVLIGIKASSMGLTVRNSPSTPSLTFQTPALAVKAQTSPGPNPLIKRAPPHCLTPESLLALALSSVWSPPAEELLCLPVESLGR